jgi:hypothetical protein
MECARFSPRIVHIDRMGQRAFAKTDRLTAAPVNEDKSNINSWASS